MILMILGEIIEVTRSSKVGYKSTPRSEDKTV